MRAIFITVLVLTAGCVRGVPDEAALSAKERQQAEFAACWNGTLPPWLDDAALAEATRLDRWGAFGAVPSDSYQTGTAGSHQASIPLPPGEAGAAGSRHAAILAERREFRARCDLLKATRRGPSLPTSRGIQRR